MIRVAYEVSSIAPPPGGTWVITGIGRVIEEQLAHLRNNRLLDFAVVGAYGGDWNPIITSMSVERWAAVVCKPPVRALSAFKTKSQLAKAVVRFLYRLEEEIGRKRVAKVSERKQRPLILATAVVRRLAHACVKIGLDANEIDLFHATFRSPPEWLPSSLPRVVTVHDVIPLRHPEDSGPDAADTLRRLLGALDPRRDVVVAVSRFTKDDFCELSGFPPDRVVVAHLSAAKCFRPVEDGERLAQCRARLQLSDEPFILSVANPQPRKNIPLLVRSFFAAATRLPSWSGRLVLVGNPKAGWGIEKINQEIAQQPTLANRVVWASGVSDEDLACLYSQCDAFVFPSSYEGFGLPVLEALQSGAPVICSNRSSLPEVVGDAAVLIDPNEAELVHAMVDLLTNSTRRNELRTRGIIQAKKFSWESSAENVAQAYMMAVDLSRKHEASRPGAYLWSASSPIGVVRQAKRAVIASGTLPTYVGGLGAYQRFLASALEQHYGIKGSFLALTRQATNLKKSDEELPWPGETLRVRPIWRIAQRFLPSMASRRILHPLLELVVSLAVPASSVRKSIGSADWIHFVGTGWDFIGFALLSAARANGIRFTVWPAVHPKSWGDDDIDVRLYRRADRVFCQSNYEMGHLATLGVPPRVLRHCGLPPMCRMDGNRDRFRADHQLSEEMPSVLFLGRRDQGKGYPSLLKAWRLVSQKYQQAVLLLAGPGGSEFENLKASLPSSSVRDLGVPDEARKADAIAGCDVFCLPSAHESFGIAYVEAWAYGRPVICGEAPACRELIEDGVTGIWANQDPAILAAKVLSLLQQPDLRARLGSEGRARQQRDLTPERVVNTHLKGLDSSA